MRKLLFALLLLPLDLSAQEENWMSPDRPGVATGTDVMPFKKVMWETGFEGDWIAGTHCITMPSTMFRFGITSFAELRVEYDGILLRKKASNGSILPHRWYWAPR